MKLEVFTEILNRLRKQSDKHDILYELDIDLINFSDDHASVINILLEVYYGKDGADWISWYLWERDPLGTIDQATTSDGTPICYDIQSLWEEVEQCRLDNTKEYELPVTLTDEQKLEVLTMIKNAL